jgi:hypothetical protein
MRKHPPLRARQTQVLNPAVVDQSHQARNVIEQETKVSGKIFLEHARILVA